MDKIQSLFHGPVAVINLGLGLFYQNLQERNVPSIDVAWQPPTVSPKLQEILNKIRPLS